MARKSAEQRVMDLDAQIAQLKERKREAMARYSEDARKADSHARYAIGSLVLEHFDGDWRVVDMAHLESLLNSNHDFISRCVVDEMPLDEARRAMRSWEAAHRAKGSEAAAAEAPGAGSAYGEVL